MTPAALESPTPDTPETPRRDFRQEVTDNIIAMLEKGVATWQKPWDPGKSSLELPHNRKVVSRRERGFSRWG